MPERNSTTTPLRDEARAAIDIVATALQDAVRQELDALRGALQSHLVTLDRVVTHDNMNPTFEPIVEHLCATVDQRVEAIRSDLEERATQAESAAAKAKTAREAADRQAAAARKEAEAAVTRVAAARKEADAAAAQLTTAREELDEARERIDSLEKAQADLALQRDIDAAHLEGETHNRAVLAAELESARAQVLQVRAEANALRLELQRNGGAAGQAPSRARSERTAGTGAALEQVRAALQTLARAPAGQELLAASLELLSEHFPRVALCASNPQGVTVWRSRGFDRPLESRKGALQLADDSPVWRALESGQPVTMTAAQGETVRGLSASPAAYTTAIPLVSSDKLTMILYGEFPSDAPPRDLSTAETFAGIIADHVTGRLKRKAAAPEAVTGGPQTPVRRARRMRLAEGTSVDIDGTEGTLVDLSLVGAQVLSARAMKPNRTVKLVLPGNHEGVSCEARVVWALVEPSADQRKSRYRAGVQFTEVDASQIEAFFADNGFSKHDIKH